MAVKQHSPELTPSLLVVMAVAIGAAVANNYYAQPLLPAIEHSLHLSPSGAGLIVTVSQVGYALGLVFVLPLGDLLERRGLVVAMALGVAVALFGVASAPSGAVLLPAALLVGTLSVIAQILVAMAAGMASDTERGRVVAYVMTGLLLGILLARTVAGYVAELGGWRTVYYAAAALMLTQTAVLAWLLPTHRQDATIGYGRLLASVRTLLRDEAVLRQRALYGALSFAAFSVLWTSIAFLLAGKPYHYGTGTIGLFGLVGASGVFAANLAGRLADHGYQRLTTGCTAVLLLLAWLPLWLGRDSIGVLIVGILLVDLAAQGLHITNQSEIYRLRPDARSRINSAYMTFYFLGGAVGSAASAAAYAADGWSGVVSCGATLGGLLTLVWALSLMKPVRPSTPALRSMTLPSTDDVDGP